MSDLGAHIKAAREYRQMTLDELAKSIGVTKQSLSGYERGKINPTKKNLESIQKVLRVDLSKHVTTRLLGNRKSNSNAAVTAETLKQDHRISDTEKQGYLPYYDMIVTAGNVGVYSDEESDKPLFFMDIPMFRDCSMYHRLSGDSMYPKYRNGDVVAAKEIVNKSLIMWGEDYLVITQNYDYRTVKTLLRGENGIIRLVPVNDDYQEVEIQQDDILSLFLVRGVVSQR